MCVLRSSFGVQLQCIGCGSAIPPPQPSLNAAAAATLPACLPPLALQASTTAWHWLQMEMCTPGAATRRASWAMAAPPAQRCRCWWRAPPPSSATAACCSPSLPSPAARATARQSTPWASAWPGAGTCMGSAAAGGLTPASPPPRWSRRWARSNALAWRQAWGTQWCAQTRGMSTHGASTAMASWALAQTSLLWM